MRIHMSNILSSAMSMLFAAVSLAACQSGVPEFTPQPPPTAVDTRRCSILPNANAVRGTVGADTLPFALKNNCPYTVATEGATIAVFHVLKRTPLSLAVGGCGSPLYRNAKATAKPAAPTTSDDTFWSCFFGTGYAESRSVFVIPGGLRSSPSVKPRDSIELSWSAALPRWWNSAISVG